MKKNIVFLLAIACVFCVSLVLAPKPIQAAEAPVTFEEAFGASTGLALYNIQVILGITADSFYKSVYTAEEANGIVNEQKSAMTTLKNYIEKLSALKTTSAQDKKSLAEMAACIDKLDETATSLLNYIGDSSDENASTFDEKRKASYAAIADLLGLEK